MQDLKKRGRPVPLPPNPAPYLTEWWLEIGPTCTAGMGEGSITWQEMAAWQGLTGIELDPWEARTIRSMSQAFAAQKPDARKADCPAPYLGNRETLAIQRPVVAQQVKALFGALNGRVEQKKG